MSEDDVEFVSIELIDESDSDDGSSKRRCRNRSRASLDLAETDDESAEGPVRHKRKTSRNPNGESGKRSAKRKRQNLFESDDESAKKRVNKKLGCSSDSDYEPSLKRAQKKSKVTFDSDEDSSKKRTRKKHKGSVKPGEKKRPTKSISLDSEEERAQSSSEEVPKAAVRRKRMKTTPMRARPSVDEANEKDDGPTSIPDPSVSSPDSDCEKPKSPSVEKVKTTENSSKENGADDGIDIPDNSNSCADSKDNGLNSDGDDAESSSVNPSVEVAPVDEVSTKNKVDTDEANERMDIPDARNSNSHSDNGLDSKAEKGSSSSKEVSTNAVSITRMKESPSKDDANENETKSNDDFMTIPKKSGFELGLKPKRIIGITDYGPGGVKFLIQFHGQDGAELVLNDKCHKYCPELILKYYEKHITWTAPE